MQKFKTIDEFLKSLKEPRKSEVEVLRKILYEAESELKEHIKWNAPSYSYHQDDRITFNMFNENYTRIVFHAGATRKEDKKESSVFNDESGLLEWNSNIRATVTFSNIEEIHNRKKELTAIIRKWLDIFG